MFLTPEERAYASLVAWNREPVLFTLHLAQHFHLFLPAGFDEVRLTPGKSLRGLDGEKLAHDLRADIFRSADFDITCGNLVWARFQALEFRQESSGAWLHYSFLKEVDWVDDDADDEYVDCPHLASEIFFDAPGTDGLSFKIGDLLRFWEDEERGDTRASVTLFPNIWSGESNQFMPSEAVRDFLRRCKDEKVDFSAITWRQMEELVAELLKLQGMEVTITPSSGDGGRDVIARGELVPGEPTIIAVEVKQKPVVDIQDVRAALYANRDMPALLIATSGRFSAGVIKEARGANNRYRLFLKDGVALRQWIDACWQKVAAKPETS